MLLVIGAEGVNLALEEGEVGLLGKDVFGIACECGFGIGFLGGELPDLLPKPRPVTSHDVVGAMAGENEGGALVVGR